MKFLRFLTLPAALLLLAGCASSERMVRMSAGVFDEYKAPPSYRVRSARFQQKSTAFTATEKSAAATQIADFDAPLVNIWPFFFRSRSYFSILWPFIDWDAYGMAIRPFYNQEGDEYSVLFPLSAWNPVNKDGWVLNFAWTPHGFGWVPFSWQHEDDREYWYYYAPFLIYSKDKSPLDTGKYRRISKDESFFLFLLGYLDVDLYADLSGAGEMLNASLNKRRYLAKKYGFDAPPEKDTSAWERKLFSTLPRYRKFKSGIVPLFHCTTDSRADIWSWRAACYLAGGSRSGQDFGWDVLTPLFMYYSSNKFDSYFTCSSTSFWALPLLTFYKKQVVYPADQPLRKILAEADKAVDSASYGQNRPLVEAFLKKHSPGTTIPDTVVDRETLELFMNDWKTDFCKGKTFETASRTNWGILPLFCSWDEEDSKESGFFSLAALTRYAKDKNGSNFWSVPLLTYADKDSCGDSFCILPPLIWMDFTRHHQRHHLTVHSRTTRDTAQWQCADTEDIYAACGLFYRGKVTFFVAKPGIDHNAVNTVRSNLNALPGKVSHIKRREKYYRNETDKLNKWVPDGKIDHYRKLIRIEELKKVSDDIRKQRGKYHDLLKTTQNEAAKLGVKFVESDVQSASAVQKVIARLYDSCAELRSKEDIGSGILFRRENFYNGDYKWHLLHFLAGGEKTGDREKMHILHFLYRKQLAGDKSETHFFPFVSILKDGTKERVSFLGRVWQRTTINGKSSGYLFFIPW